MLRTRLALVLPLVVGLACEDKPVVKDAGPQEPRVVMVERRVERTPIMVTLPSDWLVENLTPPMPERRPGDEVGPIVLRSRTMMNARAREEAGAPWLMVLHDAWLPNQTDASGYLDAQRASNRATHANLKHVDAERSTLNGRPVYRVRDEWSADIAGTKKAFTQEALIALDKVSADDINGYVLVLTQQKRDAEQTPELSRKILDSVRFIN